MAVESFNGLYNVVYKNTKDIASELENIITPDIDEVPPLIDIKDVDDRYKYYSKAVNVCLKLSRLLSNAYFTKDTCVRMKALIQKDVSLPPKLMNQYIRDTDILIQELDGYILSATAHKNGIDNLNRFYQNVCYMFGGIVEVKSSI